jgi:tetratricopeptide (TPR) repeat protein
MPFIARHMKSEFERAVALDGNNLDARDGLVDFYSIAPGFMGGGIDKAREQAQTLVGLNAMRGHLALARVAMRGKDKAAVEREANAAIAAAPDSLRPYAALTSWYVNDKDWAHAFATMDRYIARRPSDPNGPYGIGRVAAASGEQLDRGEQGLRAFLAHPPGGVTPPVMSRAHLRLGQVLQHQGRTAPAREEFEQALKIDPRNEEADEALKQLHP